MAKFLTTIDIASQLRELITEADKILYLVSPYLQLSKDFQELIISREKNKKETIIIYGKNELNPDQLKFLTSLRYVYLKFYENLHAKCYVNDTKLIITSLNFYEYSMINNKEMGVLYDNTNPDDKEIYSKAFEYVKLIEDNSDDKPFELTGSKAVTNNNVDKKNEPTKEQAIIKSETKKSNSKQSGYCIRTGVEIPFNVDKPMGYDAYKSWSKYSDAEYPEKFCHFSGEQSNGETSVSKPILKKNWKKAKEIHGL